MGPVLKGNDILKVLSYGNVLNFVSNEINQFVFFIHFEMYPCLFTILHNETGKTYFDIYMAAYLV